MVKTQIALAPKLCGKMTDNTLSSQIIGFYTDDGEGIMSGTADAKELIQLK